MGQVRRRRPHRAQRSELHRARLRRARGAWAAPTAATPPSRSSSRATSIGSRSSAKQGARWFHTGGIFCALSETTPARRRGGDGSRQEARHDRLLRPQLSRLALEIDRRPGKRAQEVNRELAPLRRRDDRQRRGLHRLPRLRGRRAWTSTSPNSTPTNFKQDDRAGRRNLPELQGRCHDAANAKTATVNDWGAICWADGDFYQARTRERLEIFDRVGGGDSFASGLIYGFLAGKGPQWAVECGAAHGALAMTTPGDTTMATLGRSRARDEGRDRPRRALVWIGGPPSRLPITGRLAAASAGLKPCPTGPAACHDTHRTTPGQNPAQVADREALAGQPRPALGGSRLRACGAGPRVGVAVGGRPGHLREEPASACRSAGTGPADTLDGLPSSAPGRTWSPGISDRRQATTSRRLPRGSTNSQAGCASATTRSPAPRRPRGARPRCASSSSPR